MLSVFHAKFFYMGRLGFTLLLTGILLITGNLASSEAAKSVIGKQGDGGPFVTMTVENISISKAAALIEGQTGYRISLEGLGVDLPVTGRFSEIDLTTVFTSLLRDYNLGILVDHTKRQVHVQSLGKKPASRLQDSNDTISAQEPSPDKPQLDVTTDNVLSSENNSNSHRDPFTGQSYSEIIALHNKQEADIERDQQNPQAIDPLSGMTNAEIWALHEKQKKAIADSQP